MSPHCDGRLRLLCVTFYTLPEPEVPMPSLQEAAIAGAELESSDDRFMNPGDAWPWFVDEDGALSDVHAMQQRVPQES